MGRNKYGTYSVAPRREWSRGRRDRWRVLYRQVRGEISRAKRETAADIEQHDPNSIQFTKGIKNVMNLNKKKLDINFLGDISDADIGDTIRDHYTSICTKYPSIDHCKLPAFLPAHDYPVIDQRTVYDQLIKLKLSKASAPNQIPKKILR